MLLHYTSTPTCLQENQHLNELMLHWEWWNDMVAEGIFDPTIQLIEGIRRNLGELKVLRIISYKNDKLPSWLTGEGSLSILFLFRLTTVHLVNLRRCERLPLGCVRLLEQVVLSVFLVDLVYLNFRFD